MNYMKRFAGLVCAVAAVVFFASCSKDKESGTIAFDSPAVFLNAGDAVTVGFSASNIESFSITGKPTGWSDPVIDAANRTITVISPEKFDDDNDAVKSGSVTLTGKVHGGSTASATLFVGVVDTEDLSRKPANSYLINKKETNYLIDAMYKGDLTEQVPSSVDVVWQSRSNLIQYLELKDGKASFYIGADTEDSNKILKGNAVIGAYDANDELIWSWHVWATDYDPAATAQTYASGAVFMDRNLGALETDYTLPASRGLYYQWGRKDPFPYPATATDAYIQAPTVYAAGFEYAESDPRTSGTESPYDVMTLEWATAHPTTYMDGVSFEDWEEWASSLDWLCDHHPNLWGNVTTGKNNISRTSHKSIYDPCPPGWKVPGAEDFAGIERISVSAPYYVTIRCNGTQTAKIPLGGTFYEGRYDRNGSLGRLYTNAPYYLHWGGSTGVFHDVACTSIVFDTSNYPPFVNTTDFYRYAANPVRCVRE